MKVEDQHLQAAALQTTPRIEISQKQPIELTWMCIPVQQTSTLDEAAFAVGKRCLKIRISKLSVPVD